MSEQKSKTPETPQRPKSEADVNSILEKLSANEIRKLMKKDTENELRHNKSLCNFILEQMKLQKDETIKTLYKSILLTEVASGKKRKIRKTKKKKSKTKHRKSKKQRRSKRR
tara:strand:- start:5045 stop:5380 length:336 start_codon:yes stop_codon:yes gene_type:complete